jgi:prepilin-type N-terminal cleavage/methylation domain-containing protein
MNAPRRGFTLVELLIALTLGAIVLGAMYRVLAGNQRYYRAQGEVTEVQQNLRAIGLILPAEFRELAASEGDIVAMSATELEIRAMRNFMVICDAPGASTIEVRNSLTYGYRSVDNARDSLVVFSEGNPDIRSDDTWLIGYPSSSTASTCSDGDAATEYTITGVASLANVLTGAPVRSFERVRYSVYDDGSGTWWLGVETMEGGSYNAVSPVAGPLRGADGIAFAFYDSLGVVTADPLQVASIAITARGKSANQINVPGRPMGYYYDSVVVRTALRNN